MKRSFTFCLVGVALVFSSGCATIRTFSGEPDGPTFMAGTRMDIASVTGNVQSLCVFKNLGKRPLSYWPAYIDFPASVLADIVLSPITAGMALARSSPEPTEAEKLCKKS